MTTIFTADNEPTPFVYNAFVRAGRKPNLFGGPEISRAIARSIFNMTWQTSYLLTGVTLSRVAKEVLKEGLENSSKSEELLSDVSITMIETEFYSILADGIQGFLDEDRAEFYRWCYGMVDGVVRSIGSPESETEFKQWKESVKA